MRSSFYDTPLNLLYRHTLFVSSLLSPTLCSGLMPLLMGLILVVVYLLIISLLRHIYVVFLLIIIAQGTTKVLACTVSVPVNTG